MKRKLLVLSAFMLMVIGLNAQKTHFDNKPHVDGEMLVQLLPGAGMRQVLSRAPANYGIEYVEELSKPMLISLIKFDSDAISHEGIQFWLYSQPEVVIADYNYLIDMRATTPGDPNFNQQWHHVNDGSGGGTADADIDSDDAWDITTGGTTATGDDIVVCLIESGNLDHNDITGNRWFNQGEIENNGIDDDGNGYIDDYHGWNPVQNNDNYGTGGHGTNCLGMIGAKGDNGTLVVGANWDVKLMVVGDYSISTQANAIQAYTYPLVMRQRWNNSGGTDGAFVVATSSSWGIDGADPNNYPLWCAFYDTLGAYGILNVGATTNSEFNVDTGGDMPTACNSNYMIGVGRTDNNDNTAGGYGPNTIEFGAPGINVVTTANTNTTTSTTGTSFSCPLTAGVIGLAYSIPCTDFMGIVQSNPQQGADLVLQALLDGVDVKANLATRFITSGRLNSRNTLDELMAVACTGTLCLAPSGPQAINIGDNTADLSFTPFGSATSQNLYWREVGSATWTAVNNAVSPVSLSGLNGCSDYEFYLESICGTDTSSAGATQTFSTTGCGNCIDLAYCTNNATDGVDEWIEELIIDTYTNTSGNDGGYGDFTGNGSVQLTINGTYNFTITPGWAGTLYDEYSRIWIDLDQNGTFDAADLVYDQGTSSQAAVTGSITIPGTAVLGSTRMRVQLAYDSGTLPAECGSFQYGEVEDYCVEILADVICGLVTTETVTDPSCNGDSTGSISIDNVSGGSPGYTYDWGAAGGNVSSISSLPAGSYSVLITDNASCDTTISFTLVDPPAINATATVVDPDCNGANTGSVTIDNITNGDGNYTLDWGAAGGDVMAITSQSAGNYTATVTDGAGCSNSFDYTLTDPVAHSAGFTSTTNALTANFTNTSVGTGTYAWDFGDSNTDTQLSPSHTYATPGTYTVCLTLTTACTTDQTCSDVTVDNVGIGELDAADVSVYPNPSNDLVNFMITDANVVTIEILDIVGKVIKTINVKEELTQVDVSNYASGTYFYNLKDAIGVTLLTNKIVVSE
ncbi:MAG: S8 family serine peptidase [Crocinitomicaceae bacterium]|nr:S8 family serine peptidase [Crocinitomicaceae bacterium]